MLLTNRRHRLLFLSLAGMDAAWFLPLALTVIVRWQAIMMAEAGAAVVRLNGLTELTPLAAMLLAWLTLLLYMLVADLLNRRLIDSPARELLLLGAALLTTLIGVRMLLYPDAAPGDWQWVGSTANAVFNFTAGWRPELALVLINLFLWWRVVMASGRELSFFQVGLSFRLGLLAALLGNGLLVGIGGKSTGVAVQYFWLFCACGLVAVALARIDEKAVVGEHSTGSILPWSRFGQVLLAAGGTLGLGGLAAMVYTTGNIRTFLGWFSPLWQLLGSLAYGLAYGVAWLLAPLMNWLVELLRQLLADMELPPPQEQSGDLYGEMAQEEFFSVADAMREWTLLRYCFVTSLIVLVLGLLFLLYVRTQNRRLAAEEETVEAGESDWGGDALRRGWDRLRELGNLLGRFGLSNQLLDAISVQNMYANLSRIARGRGHARQPNQPPDEYLPELIRAFPAEASALARLTNAYMRVHYGDQPLDGGELARLRTDYERVKESPETETEEAD